MTEGDASAAGRLQESEQRYQTVIEYASDMIQSCRPDGSFEFVNRAWCEKLGYTIEEAEKLNVWDIIHPDSVEHCMDIFMRASQGESFDHVPATFLTKDGRALPVEGNARSRYLDGQVIATHSFFRDVTERVRAEQLEARNAELERERIIRSLEKMAALGKLSAGLAHELNNPAAAAQRAADRVQQEIRELQALTVSLCQRGLEEQHWGQLQTLLASMEHGAGDDVDPLALSDREEAAAEWLDRHGVEDAWVVAPELVRGDLGEEHLESLAATMPAAALDGTLTWLSKSRAVAELVQTIGISTHTISDLVGAVKEYSYMDRAPEQEVDIHQGIESTLRILGHKLKEGVRVVRDFDRDLPTLTVPAGELNQVWTNLIDNAIDAASPGGEVRIRTYRDENGLAVEVADNGPGIPEDVRPHIFDTFFTTKGPGKGTGLGLEVSRRVVTELCGGTISFESEPGNTRFRVWLPLDGSRSRQAGG